MPKRKVKTVDDIFCSNLIYYRKLNQYTQQQVADALNLNRTTYTKYEIGVSEPTYSVLRKIVELYKIDFNNLFAPINTKNNSSTVPRRNT